MRDPEASLLDIVTYAKRISGYVDGVTHDEFVSDIGIQDQVIRCLTVIGESAKRTPEETRSRFPAVPWMQMIGMRNRLAHEYDGVDMDALWLTATRDMPTVLQQLDSCQSPGVSSG
ncbi:MAG: DUF86 domain-containing protein [Actinomycetota bacterium]|nr:DUF86 domain-containing protein [Actinomycetota bacterium]